MKRLLLISMACLLLGTGAGYADEAVRFGPFTALKIDRSVVEGVLVEGNDIYVKVSKEYWHSDFAVKISNKNNEQYRKWANGELNMPVKVYRSQKNDKQGYTYRINTTARFVEYWLDGKLVLHLERAG